MEIFELTKTFPSEEKFCYVKLGIAKERKQVKKASN